MAPSSRAACMSRPRAATKRGRVRQVEHAGDVRGGQLAHGVSKQVVRAQPLGLHQPVQRCLYREQGGLGVDRLVEQRRIGAVLRREQDLRERYGQGRVEVGADGDPGASAKTGEVS